ncbi:Hpt domain-containing protein [Methylobacillus gramineus]|uniref:hybrid sensor histidine kinase/response regulator n=1 Tax=Methylobacillus gramineus TaxID=755169 RepID=UPI001CFFB066|nr:Hpt domain-containing protein [Methylobacillus gramineus]MCB5184086.1 Hpt domain-containing protein [Methylobacillus gramineus]
MVEDFDIGPLSWVKGEIDQALSQVQTHLAAVATHPADLSPLRFSQPHLYQVSGALDMVGLEGCKRYCSEIETVVGKLEKALLSPAPEVMETLNQSIRHLQQYLQDLLNGQPDHALRLSGQLQKLAALSGEALEESELFFPDTSLRLPRDIGSEVLEPATLLSVLAEQRAIFQKSLLGWLKGSGQQGIDEMVTALDRVQQVQTQSAQKTIWWVATAFIETMAQQPHASDSGVKRLCRRLDQQLRSAGDGATRAASALLRDLLYYIAISTVRSERLSKVRQVFELDGLLPASTMVVTGVEEQAYVSQCLIALENLKEIWARAGAEDDVFSEFITRFTGIADTYPLLSIAPLVHLWSAVESTARSLQVKQIVSLDIALVEVASALTLLDSALQHYGQQDAVSLQTLQSQAERLQQLQAIDHAQNLAAAPTADLQKTAQVALAREIGESLKAAEQYLDAYFRQPDDASALAQAALPLRQAVSALDMLELPLLQQLTNTAVSVLERLQEGELFAGQYVFELLADSLSLVDMHLQQYPYSPTSSLAMDDALSSLQGLLQHTESANSLPQHGIEYGFETPVELSGNPLLALDAELLDIYLVEVEEVLALMAQNLQYLRVNATDHRALTEVRRGFHTLKGSGRTVGLLDIGEVGGIAEKLLNLVIERKLSLDTAVTGFAEQVAAAFADWAGRLREQQRVVVDVAFWQQQAALLEDTLAHVEQSEQAEEVLIGGTRRISRGLFDVFLQEASQHLMQLQHWVERVHNNTEPLLLPDTDVCRAAHTLASNAGATGFKPLSDLARALEHWLDVHQGNWSAQSVKLLQNTVTALENMRRKAAELKQSRAATALLRALKKATEEAGVPVIDTATGSNVVDFGARLAKTADAVASVLEAEAKVTALHDQPVPNAPIVPAVTESPPAETLQAVQPQLVDQELFALFVEEASDLVPMIGNQLRAWYAHPQEADHPDILQRALHTLKGSARMAGQGLLGDAVHGMEDHVMRALKNRPQANDFEDMFVDLDRIGSLLEDAMGGSSDLMVGRQAAPDSRGRERRAQYLRLRADILDRLINEAGEVSIARSRMDREMQSFKQSSLDLTESVQRLRGYLRELEIEAESQLQSRMTLLQETNETFDPLEFDRFTRLQELTRMMAESVNDVSTIQHGLLRNLDETEAALQQQNRMNRELQYGLMNARRVPFSLITERLHRIVRQTARELDKRVELVIDGADIEIDRSVLDRISASIEHILRNSVAHGIESPPDRRRLGKAERGNITLKVRQESDEIVLVVSDDGKGIALDDVRKRALDQHLLPPDQEVSEQALLALIFEPGFTTARVLSQIAGRGVGLDAVRTDITALGGRIDVSSSTGTGAIFSIFLPVTLSVSQAVLVRYATRQFALPAVMVEQVLKLKPESLEGAYATGSVLWSDRHYPLYFLGRLTGDAAVPEKQRYSPIILLRSGQYRIALHVDDIVGNQEVVMKTIGPQLARVPGMIGATVMGDGGIVLLINPVQLANRESLAAGAVSASLVSAPEPVAIKPLALLVDDSLTMRKVLSRLLEREGYEVAIAKDGMEAIQAMQETLPDIILTDIEMPRMDGFELARNVRHDERSRHIPLVIVSSRTAEKHQAMARSLGVNAFFGKPVQEDDLILKLRELLA